MTKKGETPGELAERLRALWSEVECAGTGNPEEICEDTIIKAYGNLEDALSAALPTILSALDHAAYYDMNGEDWSHDPAELYAEMRREENEKRLEREERAEACTALTQEIQKNEG